MPGLYDPNHQRMHRRDFLKASFLAGAAVVWHGCQTSPLSSGNEIHLALLSDTHIPGDCANDPRRPFNPCENLKRVVADIVSGSPSGVILNGDAASREGLKTDYHVLKGMLEPAARVAPIYIGLGNHDDRQNFKEIFTSASGKDASVPNHQVLIVEETFLRFIVLDSLFYVNKVAGLLGEQQRSWLAEYLKSHREKPAVLFVHHTLGDSDGDLLDANRLFEVIRPHRQVKAIFYGHSHVWNLSERQGVKLINLPALGYNFTDDAPVGWVDARFRRDGVDLTLHAIGGNRAQDGQTSRIRWT